jgi:hypothetical protein
VFSQPKVESEFRKFVTVRLYTAPTPAGLVQVPDGAAATELRDQRFKNYALPYYVIVKVKGNTLEKIAFYEQGIINDADEFVNFLEKALAAAR